MPRGRANPDMAVPNPNNNNIFLNIQSFSGEQAHINFFLQQIRDLQSLNNWSDFQTLQFLKTKLTGAALHFYMESPTLCETQDLQVVLDSLKTFFQQNEQFSIAHLHSFHILPTESINNMAHRLDTIINKVYSQIRDPQTLNSIKFTHFLTALPSHVSIQLQYEGVKEYTKAVERAQELQQIQHNQMGPSASNVNMVKNEELHKELQDLREQIRVLKQTQNAPVHNVQSAQFHSSNRSNDHRSSLHKTHNKPIFKKSFLKCQFCGKPGHSLWQCYSFKDSYVPVSKYNLRPNAKSFEPSSSYRQRLN